MQDAHVQGNQTMAAKAVILFVVVGPLIATAYAIHLLWGSLVNWQDLAIFAGMYVLCGMGIAIGFHRMLTHRGFDAPEPVRGFFMALGSMALEGPAVEWAATHVKHHAKSDQEGDPHSPLEGFWHAHMGWLFRDRFVKTGVWVKPFENDKTAWFIDRTFWVWAVLGFALPAGVGFLINGGWPGFWTGLLWGGLVRTALLHHVTWSVNSVCHTFGTRPYETKDASRNNVVIGLLGFGEGWHNNHHAQPAVALHGHRWYQVDPAGYVIRTMARLKLVRNVVRPNRKLEKGRQPEKPVPTSPVAASSTMIQP